MSDEKKTTTYEEVLEEVISAEEYCLYEETVEALPEYLQQKLEIQSVELSCDLITNEEEQEVQILTVDIVDSDGNKVQLYAAINEDEQTVEFGDIPDEEAEEEEDFDDFDEEDEDEDEEEDE